MAFWLEDGACEKEGVDTSRMVVGLRRQGLTKDLAYNDRIVQIGGRTGRIGRAVGNITLAAAGPSTLESLDPWQFVRGTRSQGRGPHGMRRAAERSVDCRLNTTETECLTA